MHPCTRSHFVWEASRSASGEKQQAAAVPAMGSRLNACNDRTEEENGKKTNGEKKLGAERGRPNGKNSEHDSRPGRTESLNPENPIRRACRRGKMLIGDVAGQWTCNLQSPANSNPIVADLFSVTRVLPFASFSSLSSPPFLFPSISLSLLFSFAEVLCSLFSVFFSFSISLNLSLCFSLLLTFYVLSFLLFTQPLSLLSFLSVFLVACFSLFSFPRSLFHSFLYFYFAPFLSFYLSPSRGRHFPIIREGVRSTLSIFFSPHGRAPPISWHMCNIPRSPCLSLPTSRRFLRMKRTRAYGNEPRSRKWRSRKRARNGAAALTFLRRFRMRTMAIDAVGTILFGEMEIGIL